MKKIISASLVGIMCLSLVSCSKPTGDGAVSNVDKTKIVFWHTWNDVDFKHDVEEIYNKKNKDNIEVEFKVITGDYRQSVDLAIMSGNVPDAITAVGPSQVTALAEKKQIIPLTKYLTPELRDSFEKGFETKVNNETYGVAGTSYVRRMLYNADIFRKAGLDPDKPPKTFAEMVKDAKIISEKGNGEYYGMAIPLGSPDSVRTQLVYRVGGPTLGVNSGYEQTKKKYDFLKFEPILTDLQKMYNDNVFLPGSATLNSDQEGVQFAAGKVGMTILTSGFATRFGVLPDLSYDFDMRSCDIPMLGEQKYSYVIESPGAQVILSDSKHQDAAWKFIEWTMSLDRAQNTQRTIYSEVPFNKEVIKDQEKYLKKSPTSDLFKIDYSKYRSETLLPGPNNIALQGDSDSKVFANIIMANLDVKTALNDLTKRYNEALDKTVADGKNNLDDFYFTPENNPLLLK